MAIEPFEFKTVEPKKPMEEMTDKELMAYCMKYYSPPSAAAPKQDTQATAM